MLNDENKFLRKSNHEIGMIIEDYDIQSLRSSQETDLFTPRWQQMKLP